MTVSAPVGMAWLGALAYISSGDGQLLLEESEDSINMVSSKIIETKYNGDEKGGGFEGIRQSWFMQYTVL